MKNENEKLDQLFENLENQWDVHEIDSQHINRFSAKLALKKRKNSFGFIYAIAASVVVMLGITLFYTNDDKPKELKFASKETKQTDSIFTVLIEHQLDQIKAKESPENEKIINDALKQMKALDSDYEKIKHELEINGESKPIIYAMISNLQTRISFLQNVLQRLQDTEKLKKLDHEKTI
ncbi:anti-sigma factor [Flavobacterium laiguense]|uniref:Anti-sigma factor n=1 Tax=Flavobacterium laiguense TaxID=2169409 RepID=A0A2U1JSD1_9FLAO|nr:anti-sigma factor [Flavobacterium laiguense]PWA07854.1 anti-sigma factor [Flavobacterium laiguense]